MDNVCHPWPITLARTKHCQSRYSTLLLWPAIVSEIEPRSTTELSCQTDRIKGRSASSFILIVYLLMIIITQTLHLYLHHYVNLTHREAPKLSEWFFKYMHTDAAHTTIQISTFWPRTEWLKFSLPLASSAFCWRRLVSSSVKVWSRLLLDSKMLRFVRFKDWTASISVVEGLDFGHRCRGTSPSSSPDRSPKIVVWFLKHARLPPIDTWRCSAACITRIACSCPLVWQLSS